MSDLNDIEGQISEDRAKLSGTLDQLSATLDPNRLTSNVTSSIEEYGGEIGRQAMTAAKQNPVAFALLAAGVGLLLTGTGTERRSSAPRRQKANDPEEAMDGFDARVTAADAASKANIASDDRPSASWLKAHLESGLEALPASARRRVIKTRKAAIAAQERVEEKAARLARNTRTFHSKQPLAVGGLALGVGALVGALLPNTRREDEWLGDHRDQLVAKAHRALEKEKAALKGALDEGVRAAANHSETHRTHGAMKR